MWQWKYEIGDRVKINESARWGLPNMINREGIIIEQLESKHFSYSVKLDDNVWTVRVKENEIDLVED